MHFWEDNRHSFLTLRHRIFRQMQMDIERKTLTTDEKK
jgi:hypothetical protein